MSALHGQKDCAAALLFAFASVRNAQPGTPPIGTYSDFISFFWAEVIIALCLVILVFTWVLRHSRSLFQLTHQLTRVVPTSSLWTLL